MANTLTSLIPTIYQSLDTVSRELVGFIPNVFRNASAEQAAKDQVITYPIAPAGVAQDIAPGVTAPNAGDNVVGNGSVTISKSRAVPVRWNGEEQKGAINAGWYNQLLADQFTQSFRTLTNEVESDLAGLYAKASRAYGTAATTPFGTANDMTDLAETLKILKDNGAGNSDLKLILGTTAAAKIRGKQSGLFKVNEAGTDVLLRTGSLGKLEGFDLGESAQVKSVTAGTGAGYLVNNIAGYAVGDTTIAADTGAGTILAGDVITFAGDTNKYVVATALAAGSLTLAKPGLQKALADNAAITVGAAFTANIAFRKSAIHLISRSPTIPIGPDGRPMDMAEDIVVVTDPFTGIAFQVAVYKQFRQVLYYVGLAWGVNGVKTEHSAILLG